MTLPALLASSHSRSNSAGVSLMRLSPSITCDASGITKPSASNDATSSFCHVVYATLDNTTRVNYSAKRDAFPRATCFVVARGNANLAFAFNDPLAGCTIGGRAGIRPKAHQGMFIGASF